jgi:hypothetical protein
LKVLLRFLLRTSLLSLVSRSTPGRDSDRNLVAAGAMEIPKERGENELLNRITPGPFAECRVCRIEVDFGHFDV